MCVSLASNPGEHGCKHVFGILNLGGIWRAGLPNKRLQFLGRRPKGRQFRSWYVCPKAVVGDEVGKAPNQMNSRRLLLGRREWFHSGPLPPPEVGGAMGSAGEVPIME